ncbi:MAG: PIN domain-containing protein [Spirochaetes bacterium]|nr:PIN domain-containing protein [Spirochaetota bacterium]
MLVIIDTCIWSEALRKSDKMNKLIIQELTELIKEDRVIMLGLIRQEILSGIKSKNDFLKLKKTLKAFEDYQVTTEDYEFAAEIFNKCKSKGIQGSNTDFLICAVAIRNNYSIFTADKDFKLYSKYIKIRLHEARKK